MISLKHFSFSQVECCILYKARSFLSTCWNFLSFFTGRKYFLRVVSMIIFIGRIMFSRLENRFLSLVPKNYYGQIMGKKQTSTSPGDGTGPGDRCRCRWRLFLLNLVPLPVLVWQCRYWYAGHTVGAGQNENSVPVPVRVPVQWCRCQCPVNFEMLVSVQVALAMDFQ